MTQDTGQGAGQADFLPAVVIALLWASWGAEGVGGGVCGAEECPRGVSWGADVARREGTDEARRRGRRGPRCGLAGSSGRPLRRIRARASDYGDAFADQSRWTVLGQRRCWAASPLLWRPNIAVRVRRAHRAPNPPEFPSQMSDAPCVHSSGDVSGSYFGSTPCTDEPSCGDQDCPGAWSKSPIAWRLSLNWTSERGKYDDSPHVT